VGEVFGVEGVEFGEFVDVGHIHRGFGDLGEAAAAASRMVLMLARAWRYSATWPPGTSRLVAD
jgi:hypothetical protein